MNKPIKETEHLHIIFKLIIAGMVSVLVIVVLCRLAFLGPFAYVWLFTPKNIHKEVSIQQAGEMLTVRYTTTYARGNRQINGHAPQGMRFSTSAPLGASVKIFVRYSKGTRPFSLAETIKL